MTLQQTLAQSFHDYTNKLLFNVLIYNPDSTIKNFISEYVPHYSHKPAFSLGEWTAYPPRHFDNSRQLVTMSFNFSKHPHFDANFHSGQLEFEQAVYNNERRNSSPHDVKLWFNFDKAEDARNAYTKLVDQYSNFKTLERLTSNNDIDKAEFTNKDSDESFSHIQFILAKDNFIIGRYRILFQVDNDLY